MCRREIEQKMLERIREVSNNPLLQEKDIRYWSVSRAKVMKTLRKDETLFHLDDLAIFCSIKTAKIRRTK